MQILKYKVKINKNKYLLINNDEKIMFTYLRIWEKVTKPAPCLELLCSSL